MITCPICYDELLNVQTESAALSCGHVFHNTCIKECLNRKKECPICRTSVNPRKDVNQLYFTSTDDAQQSSSVALPLITTSDEATLEILSLRKSIQQLMDDIRALKKSTEESISAKTKIILAKDKEIDALQIKLKNKTDSLRFVQQLRKVADLDAELSSERTRKLGKKLEKSTRDELLVYALAIHANAERAREVANLDYKNALFEISRLRKQNERLKRTVEGNINHKATTSKKIDPSDLICISDDEIEIIEGDSEEVAPEAVSLSSVIEEPSAKNENHKRKTFILEDQDTQDNFIIREDIREIPTTRTRFPMKKAKLAS